METLVLTLDTIGLMVLLYWSYRSERTPGKPELGPFRIRAQEPTAPAKPAAAVPARSVRRR